jgi:hypothetical protein
MVKGGDNIFFSFFKLGCRGPLEFTLIIWRNGEPSHFSHLLLQFGLKEVAQHSNFNFGLVCLSTPI